MVLFREDVGHGIGWIAVRGGERNVSQHDQIVAIEAGFVDHRPAPLVPNSPSPSKMLEYSTLERGEPSRSTWTKTARC